MNKRIKKKIRKRIAEKYQYITICNGSGDCYNNNEILYYPQGTKIKKVHEENYNDTYQFSRWTHGTVYRIPKGTQLYAVSIEEIYKKSKSYDLHVFIGKECWFTIKSNCFYFDKKSNSYPHYEEHIKRIHDKLCSMGFVSYQTYTQHDKHIA